MSEIYMGQMLFAGFPFAPVGYSTCQGQIISIAQNTALFSLLGTTFGGDGQQTFSLPNANGRALLGQGQSPSTGHNYQMGEAAGSESVTITQAQMPAHGHAINSPVAIQAMSGVAAAAESPAPTNGAFLGTLQDESGSTPVIYAPAGSGGTPVNLGGGAISANTSVAGGSQPLPIMQPYLVVNALIVVQGLYPSRS